MGIRPASLLVFLSSFQGIVGSFFNLSVVDADYYQFAKDRLRLYMSWREVTDPNRDTDRDINSYDRRSLETNLMGHHKKKFETDRKSWISTPSFDGLRNEEVAVFVTSTAFKEGLFLRAR